MTSQAYCYATSVYKVPTKILLINVSDCILTILVKKSKLSPCIWKRAFGYANVRADAASQMFFSISTCDGGLIAMSSYNQFRNRIYRDSILLVVVDTCTSVFCGTVVFSVLGYMALLKNTTIDDVVENGPGLAFEVYPEALATMPLAPLWSVLFFIMMAVLGFGTAVSPLLSA
jgi:SNF family Na+-dependent transporter